MNLIIVRFMLALVRYLFLNVSKTFLLIFIPSLVCAQELYYCVQLASSQNVNTLKPMFSLIKDLPKVRIERIKDLYALRAGFYTKKEKANDLLNEVRARGFRDAFVKTCYFLPERIIVANFEVSSLKRKDQDSKEENEKLKTKLSKKNSQLHISKQKISQKTFCKLTLKDLGYTKDIVLSGISPAYTFKIPILKEFISGQMVFYIKFSKFIPKDSRIVVMFDGIPVQSYHINDYFLTVKVPLNNKEITKSFIDITLLFSLYSPQKICEFLNEANIYAIIDNKSFLEISLKDFIDSDIFDFLMDYNPHFKVIASSLFDESIFSYFLARLYKDYNLYNLKFSDYGKPIYLGEYQETYLYDRNLYFNKDDIDFLKYKSFLETDKFRKIYEKIPKNKEQFPFSYFGFKTSTYSGLGTLTFTVPFNFEGLKGKPEKIFLVLRYSNSYIKDDSFSFLEIRINNNLIFSKPVKGSFGIKEKIIEIPGKILKYGQNICSILFKYYPGSNTCEGTVPNFSVTLYDDSFFEFIGDRESYKTVYDLIQSFDGKIVLTIDKDVSNKFLLDFFKNLGYLNSKIDYFVNNVSEGDYFLMIKGFKNVSFSGFPLKYSNNFTIYDPSTKTKLLEFDGNYEFLAFEAGKYKGRDALLITYTSPKAFDFFKKFNYKDFSNFDGNLVLITETNVYSLDIGKKFRLKPSSSSRFYFYFAKYKYIILFLVIFCITLLTIYMWRRSK